MSFIEEQKSQIVYLPTASAGVASAPAAATAALSTGLSLAVLLALHSTVLEPENQKISFHFRLH